MVRQSVVKRLMLVCLVVGMPVLLLAAGQGPKGKTAPVKPLTEQELATAKPGRDSNQPIDEEYTQKIKEYTTEPYLSVRNPVAE